MSYLRPGVYYDRMLDEMVVVKKSRWIENTYNDPFWSAFMERSDSEIEFRVRWNDLNWWRKRFIKINGVRV